MYSALCEQIISYLYTERIGTVPDEENKIGIEVQPSPAKCQ
jgi:hypothetical protein